MFSFFSIILFIIFSLLNISSNVSSWFVFFKNSANSAFVDIVPPEPVLFPLSAIFPSIFKSLFTLNVYPSNVTSLGEPVSATFIFSFSSSSFFSSNADKSISSLFDVFSAFISNNFISSLSFAFALFVFSFAMFALLNIPTLSHYY